jgi:hypothetical protein
MADSARLARRLRTMFANGVEERCAACGIRAIAVPGAIGAHSRAAIRPRPTALPAASVLWPSAVQR